MKHKSNKIKAAGNPAAKTNTGKRNYKSKENSSRMWLILGGLAVLTFIVFFPMLQNQFTSWDDPDYITKNTKIWNLNSANLKFIFTEPIAYNYHPFTMLSLGFNYAVSKLDPYSYFLTNLIIHILNVLLVFWFVYLISKKNIHVSTFVALIFAIHPMHVESIAWATERKDVLYTFFFLGGLITYIFYLDTKKAIYYGATFILAACSMFSKPAAIIFPLVLIAIDYYRDGNFNIKASLNKIPLFLVAAWFMYMTLIAQTQDNSIIGDFKKYGILERFAFACQGFLIYIIKFFVPYHLATFHPYPKPIGIMTYISPLLIIGLLVGIFFWKEKRRLLTFGLLFYFINLILVLQFFSIGDALYAERYTYVPYISLAFVLGMLIFEGNMKLNRNLAWGIIGACCIGYAYVANARVAVWKGNETLWTDMIEKYPQSDRGYYDLANYYAEKNEYDKAIANFSTAIKVGTDYKTYINRGLAYSKMKNYQAALEDFDKALQMNPNQVEGYVDRGGVYSDMKRYDEALADVNIAIAKKPSYEAYFLRGYIYKSTRQYDLAIADYTTAASFSDNVSVYTNRGNVYFALQNYAKAIEDYNVVLNANPNDANTLSNRASAYFQLNQFDNAISDLNKAIALEPNNAGYYGTLAFIYDRKGDKAKTMEYANKAIKMGVNFPADFLERIRRP